MEKPWDEPREEPDFWDEVDKAYDRKREADLDRFYGTDD